MRESYKSMVLTIQIPSPQPSPWGRGGFYSTFLWEKGPYAGVPSLCGGEGTVHRSSLSLWERRGRTPEFPLPVGEG